MRHLILFARAPALGRVKRRLAADLGDVAAWRFHRATLAGAARRLGRDSRWRVVLAATPEGSRSRLLPPHLPRVGQGRGDLGRRMARAFAALPPGPAVLVGSDIPALEVRHVWRAFALLAGHDVVLGPAEDGGYWLIGFKGPRARALSLAGVRWSTKHALADTVAAARQVRLRVALADRLADVDDALSLAGTVSRPGGRDARSGAASARRNCTAASGCRAAT